MDLKAILAANQSKIKNTQTSGRKPADIAENDRPYSTPESSPAPSLEQIAPPKKPITKWQQSGNKVVTTPVENWQQTGDKVATKEQPPLNKAIIKNENWQQTGNQTGNRIDNKVATKWQQTDNKSVTIRFSELVGLQKEIIIFICHECKNNRSRVTESLTLEYIATGLKRSNGAVKTTLQRLEKKYCLQRVEFKNGRGGWSRYEVPDHIYHDALRSETGNKPTTNWQQTGNKPITQLATEPTTSTSSSSSDLILKETTTSLSEEWSFDITSYDRFGFTISQIKQLASLNVISAVDVEQSLIEFRFDFDNNTLPAIKTSNVNFLMGLFRKGTAYVSEGFKNEQEATIVEMARRAAKRREDFLEVKFEAWAANLSDDERKQIRNKLSTHLMVLYDAHDISNLEVRNWLFNYYLHSVPKS